MRKTIKQTLAGGLAMLLGVGSFITPVPAIAATRQNIDGYVVEDRGDAYQLVMIKEAAMDGTTAAIPDEIGGKPVTHAGGARLLDEVEASSVTIGKNLSAIDQLAFDGADKIETIEVSPENGRFVVENDALFGKSGGNKVALIKYIPTTGKQDYTMPDTVKGIYNMDHSEFGTLDLGNANGVYVKAFADTIIDRLVIHKDLVSISDTSSSDVLAGANVGEFVTDDGLSMKAVSDGNVLMKGTRLIKVSSDASAEDLQNAGAIESVSPFAFDSIKQYEELITALDTNVYRDVVFNFYNQDDGVFMVNGELGFCYDMEKQYPTSVTGDALDYNQDIDAAYADQIAALLYAGVPNDGLGIFEEVFGMSYQDAKESGMLDNGDAALNEVSRLVYEILGDDAYSIKNRAVDDVFTEEQLAAYADKLRDVVANHANMIFAPEKDTLNTKSTDNGYLTEKTVIRLLGPDNAPAIGNDMELTILTDGVAVDENGTKTFNANEEVKFYIDNLVDININSFIIELEYNKPALKYYRTGESVQDILVFGSDKETGKIALNLTDQFFSISKQDITTSRELSNAILTLTGDNGFTETWESGEEPHVIRNLADGHYTLTEVTAPNGYEVAEVIEFDLVDNKVDGKNEIVMYDAPLGNNLTISKQDITTSKELPNAKLTLTGDNGFTESWESTDKPHVITNPADGHYTLTEVTAPQGYEIAETIEFNITGGKVYVNGEETTGIVMYDKPIEEPITISKQDAATSKELPGATLVLKNLDTNEEVQWQSGNEPHVLENPANGRYSLTETIAPNGYELAETIEFEIRDGKVVVNGEEGKKVVMYDAPKEEKNIRISKQDAATSAELPGAKLKLENLTTGETHEWVSNGSVHVIENATNGDYRLTEISAPDGYEVAESITFTFTDGEIYKDGKKTARIVMLDKPKTKTTRGGYSGGGSSTTTPRTTPTPTPTPSPSPSPAPTAEPQPTAPQPAQPTEQVNKPLPKTGVPGTVLPMAFFVFSGMSAAGVAWNEKRKRK